MALLVVPDGKSQTRVQAQLALCHEKLGRFAEAELVLRGLLEGEPNYSTRYSHIAWYSHDRFDADLHHALARVLQRQGKAEEARLHYHLTKRIDPTTLLDPVHREVMSEEDLENHPAERAEEELSRERPRIDAPPEEIVRSNQGRAAYRPPKPEADHLSSTQAFFRGK